MMTRILAGLIAIAVLAGLIGYSQLRTTVDHVSGFVEAEDIRLGSRLGGRIAEALVTEGEQVKRGQVLVRLEAYDLAEQLQQAEAELAAREAELAKYTAGLRPEEIAQTEARYQQLVARLDKLQAGPRPQEISAAQSRLAQAEAELRLTKQNYQRVEETARRNVSTQAELDSAVEAFSAAESRLKVRQQELELLEAGTRAEEIREAEALVEESRQAMLLAKKGFRSEEVDSVRAARDAAVATLRVIKRRMAELEVTSPVDGVVEAFDLEPGDLVGPGAPFMSVLDTSKYWVRAYVPQRHMNLRIGQRVRVTIDSLPDEEFEAELTFVARQAEFTPSNVQTPEDRAKLVYRIKATLLGGYDQLRPGVTADVWLDTPAADADGSP